MKKKKKQYVGATRALFEGVSVTLTNDSAQACERSMFPIVAETGSSGVRKHFITSNQPRDYALESRGSSFRVKVLRFLFQIQLT